MNEWQKYVLPHGPIKSISDGLWIITGKLPHGNLPRNMTIYRTPSGELILHSVIALNEDGMRALEAIGIPSIMIVPNRMHRLDAAIYKMRYPNLRVLCPAAAHDAVSKKVHVDATCEDVLPKLGIKCLMPDGVKPGELVYEIQISNGRALITTDLLFNLPNMRGFEGWLFRTLGSTGFFGMTRIGRLLMLKDRTMFKAWLAALAASAEIRVIVVGHGEPILKDCSSRLSSAAAML